MTTMRTLNQSSVKRAVASAITEVLKRRDWSHRDLADALRCSASTIGNRLQEDYPGCQMDVYELLQLVDADGTHFANAIFSLVDHQLRPMNFCTGAVDSIEVAYKATRCAAELIAALPDGIDRGEAQRLLPMIVDQNASGARLEAELRAVLTRPPDTS